MSRKISAPPVQGEKCSLTSPFIEQRLHQQPRMGPKKPQCGWSRDGPSLCQGEKFCPDYLRGLLPLFNTPPLFLTRRGRAAQHLLVSHIVS